ncbi:MAG: chemotaxis response regulator protein-glutamate methylesterase [Proteobacteria bacterium]|nr:chemotaxis response regulator protein-glutamate methylesterase [Pseudomonadota bacterium]
MINVLVIDDSAFMRKAVSKMVESDPEIKVIAVARDGEEGIKLVKHLKPDIITLDIEMPRMGGLEALQHIMAEHPTPVIIVSSLSKEGAKVTLDAMDMGAVDFIPKNLTNAAIDVIKIQNELIEKIKTFAGKRLSRVKPKDGSEKEVVQHLSIPKGLIPFGARATILKTAVVAIGTSTGGPKALQDVLPKFPADFPVAILVVQHMPKAFTGPFAERLDKACQIHVKEAEDGELVRASVAYVAPGNIHMKVVRRKSTEVSIELTGEPADLLYKPSVTVMMNSVADVYPGRSVAVMMTGMGSDGLDGMRAIKEKHGRTIAQDEASCVVYGMPKAVVDAGIIDKVVSLDKISGEVANMI